MTHDSYLLTAMWPAAPGETDVRASQVAELINDLARLDPRLREWWLSKGPNRRERVPAKVDARWIRERFVDHNASIAAPVLVVGMGNGMEGPNGAAMTIAAGMYREVGLSLPSRLIFTMPSMDRALAEAQFESIVTTFRPAWAAIHPASESEGLSMPGAAPPGPMLYLTGAQLPIAVVGAIHVRALADGAWITDDLWDPRLPWLEQAPRAEALYRTLLATGELSPIPDGRNKASGRPSIGYWVREDDSGGK